MERAWGTAAARHSSAWHGAARCSSAVDGPPLPPGAPLPPPLQIYHGTQRSYAEALQRLQRRPLPKTADEAAHKAFVETDAVDVLVLLVGNDVSFKSSYAGGVSSPHIGFLRYAASRPNVVIVPVSEMRTTKVCTRGGGGRRRPRTLTSAPWTCRRRHTPRARTVTVSLSCAACAARSTTLTTSTVPRTTSTSCGRCLGSATSAPCAPASSVAWSSIATAVQVRTKWHRTTRGRRPAVLTRRHPPTHRACAAPLPARPSPGHVAPPPLCGLSAVGIGDLAMHLFSPLIVAAINEVVGRASIVRLLDQNNPKAILAKEARRTWRQELLLHRYRIQGVQHPRPESGWQAVKAALPPKQRHRHRKEKPAPSGPPQPHPEYRHAKRHVPSAPVKSRSEHVIWVPPAARNAMKLADTRRKASLPVFPPPKAKQPQQEGAEPEHEGTAKAAKRCAT